MKIDLLKKAVLEEKLSHLLLFHGSGIKERAKAVLELAAMLNCKGVQTRPCGECSDCKKIRAGNHPDIHIVKREKVWVSLEQILELQAKMMKKIYEGKYRVCLIDEADKLTPEAANALLKIAEEPPENTLIILSAANIEGVIQTLQSRSQAIYFPPPDEKEWLDDTEAFKLSGGDPDLARKISELGIGQVKAWINHYLDMIDSKDFLKIFSLHPLDKELSFLFLQVLAEKGKELVINGIVAPTFLQEIDNAMRMLRRQVNYRLVLEVLAIKHIRQGGTEIG